MHTFALSDPPPHVVCPQSFDCELRDVINIFAVIEVNLYSNHYINPHSTHLKISANTPPPV